MRPFIIILTVLSFSVAGYSQQPPPSTTSNSSEDLKWSAGIFVGPLMPSRIYHVDEVLPFWGFMLGHDFKLGRLEYNLDFANAKGISYILGYISLKNDWVVGSALGVHSLIGLDMSGFKPRELSDGTDLPWKSSGGWHIGAGAEFDITRKVLFRTDFRFGFGPGRQLLLNLGFVYNFL